MHVFDPGVVGEQALVTDTVEAGGQYMDKKASDELGYGQGHGLVAMTPLGTIVFPPKGNPVFIAGNEPTVADGDPMGVARQIGEHGLGSGERALGIDYPVDLA